MTARVRIGLRVLSNPRWRGGVHYVLNWARACMALPAAERPEVYLLHADERGLEIARGVAPEVTAVHGFDQAGQLGLDLVYPATQIFEAPFGAPWAGWIPDWQCQHLPEMFDELERARRDLHYRLLATRAPFLVLSSEMAVRDTDRVVGSAAVPHAQLSFPAVLAEGEVQSSLERLGDVRACLGVPERYVIVCNQWWRHKNHRVVLEALVRVRDSGVVCVFTGETVDHRWPEHFSEQEAFIRGEGLEGSVRVLGGIGRAEQLALMVGAQVVIQPSRFEGWSTVVEEARALGVPLLLSRFPVHEEQAPAGTRFFDAEDPDDLAGLLRDVWGAPRSIRAPDLVRQAEYVRSCARRLVAIARATRSAYDPVVHDPVVILTDLLAETEIGSEGDSIRARLQERTRSATRAMLRRDPERLAQFARACRVRHADLADRLEQLIVAPVLAAMTPEAKARYWGAGDGATVGRGVVRKGVLERARRWWGRIAE
jgi:glycosyltransferase involved in cell wall biosynthesis